ncbi:MAG: dephospho-CoA kinase [Atopobiaceae bacterium]|nr:dephospho-CoA kinase [Atopobiaceae bacterium]
MYVIYLAAGIGSGKSTVALLLEERGAHRIDLDQLSHELLTPPSDLLTQLADEFGSDILNASGELDRALLTSRAFATPESTTRLEALEHPAILAELKSRLDALRTASDAPELCVVEVPLLDHMGEALTWADEIVTVTCPVDIRRQRVKDRGLSTEDFDRRLSHQLPESWYVEQSTTAFDNSRDEAYLKQQIDAWWDERTTTGWKRHADE